jgi:hypothetical protein
MDVHGMRANNHGIPWRRISVVVNGVRTTITLDEGRINEGRIEYPDGQSSEIRSPTTELGIYNPYLRNQVRQILSGHCAPPPSQNSWDYVPLNETNELFMNESVVDDSKFLYDPSDWGNWSDPDAGEHDSGEPDFTW